MLDVNEHADWGGVGLVKGKMMDQKRVNKFLEELTVLSTKHKISIWGCGCSGCPMLVYDNEDNSIENRKYIYDVSHYKPGMVYESEQDDD